MTTAAQNFCDLHSYNALHNNRNESIVDYLDRYVSRKTRRVLGLALALDNRFNTAFLLALRLSLSESKRKNVGDGASESRAKVREYLSSLYALNKNEINLIDDAVARWARAKGKRSFYEYQGDEYRSLILEIRQREKQIELFYQDGSSSNSNEIQGVAKLRDELWWEAEEITGLDESDVLYDVEHFEDSPRVNPPAIRPTVCTL